MLSIVCCSTRPDDVAMLKENIARTIGNVKWEFLELDNRDINRSICSAYNLLAERAKGEYLCFAHQDIEFLTQDWGEKIIAKLSEKDCGVIGFAGSIIHTTALSGWRCSKRDMRVNYVQTRGKKEHKMRVNPRDVEFTPVISLDGMSLFVRKDVWSEIRFDEELLKSFHGYDLDFSIAVSFHYRNYVCNTVLIKHASVGNYSKAWLEDTKRVQAKWQHLMPVSSDNLSAKQMERYTLLTEIYFVRFLWQKGMFDEVGFIEGVKLLLRHPTKPMAWKMLLKYFVYRFRHRRRFMRKAAMITFLMDNLDNIEPLQYIF